MNLLAFGINLSGQIACGVIGICPITHIWVVHGNFAREGVIGHGADIALGIGESLEIA